MDWIFNVITSEFVWGVVVGVALSALSVVFASWLQSIKHQKVFLSFSDDIVKNCAEASMLMSKGLSEQGAIYYDYINLIDNELSVYYRNREHGIAIDSVALRKQIREYVIRVTTLNTRIRFGLNEFYKSENSEQKKQEGLAFAQRACNELNLFTDTNSYRLGIEIDKKLKSFPFVII